MNKECIFKAWGKDGIYRVVMVPNDGVLGKPIYRIYRGRKWICKAAFYDVAYAVATIVELASGVKLNVSKEGVQ